MNGRICFSLLAIFSVLLASCGPGESEFISIQELRTGGYVITLLGESAELQQSSNRLALEFRNASTNELTRIENLQIQATMSMPGMAPMFGEVSSPKATTPGRYEFITDFNMVGGWALIVSFDPNERVQFSVNAY